MTQCERVLEALKSSHYGLTTSQLHKLPFITNFRARISNLRQQGHLIECKRIAGTKSSRFVYLGMMPHISYVPDVKAMQWMPIGRGFEVLT